MMLNPFQAVGDYPAMLIKIGTFTFVIGMGAMAFVRSQFPALDMWLKPFSVSIKLMDFSIPLGTVVPALVFALLARMFKLHDVVSSVFGIRRRFEVSAILLPMAAIVGGLKSIDDIKQLTSRRRELMSQTFYEYTSTTSTKPPVIDKQLITLALDQWSWYWVVLEGMVIVTLVGGALAVCGRWLAVFFFLGLIPLIGLLHLLKASCTEYALREVGAIVSEQGRRRAIRAHFDAL
jgi:hypothetical protein